MARVVSGLTPFGSSVAHSACRVGAHLIFCSQQGLPSPTARLAACLCYFAPTGAYEFRSQASIVFPANRRFAEFLSPLGRQHNSPGRKPRGWNKIIYEPRKGRQRTRWALARRDSGVVSGLTPFGCVAAYPKTPKSCERTLRELSCASYHVRCAAPHFQASRRRAIMQAA